MRMRNLAIFMTLTLLACVLFPAANVTAGKKIVGLDDQVHSLDFSKAVPSQLNYQGFLVNAADSSAVTATLEMTFRLFDSETKGAELWSETHSAVEVSNGLFQVLLGSVTPFPDGLFDGSSMWLQTEVGVEVLTPRKPLVSVAYSRRSQMAEHAMMSDEATFAAEAYHAVRADTASYSPSANLWGASGDDVYREIGKVGIGTASPLTELDVNGSVNATTYYGDGSNLTGISGTTDNDWTIRGDTVYHETGNVGIGTTSPEMTLDVSGGITRLAGGLIVGPASSGVSGVHIYCDDSQPTLQLTNDSDLDGTCRIIFADSSDSYWSIESDLWGNHGRTLGIIDSHAKNCRVSIDSVGQVGIGTLSPARTLDVAGEVNATTYYGDGSNLTGISGTTDNDWTINGDDIYHENGNVCIGTTTPSGKLTVDGGDATIKGGDGWDGSGDEALLWLGDINHGIEAVYGQGLRLWTYDDASSDIRFQGHTGTDYMTIKMNSGNVGIGTTNPTEKLSVSGNIHASGTIKSGSSITIDGGNDRVTSSGDLEVHVNSGRVFRFESNATSPNIIGGYSGNNITPGVNGAVIGGGGYSGYINRVTDHQGTVGGGICNQAGDDAGTADDAPLATVGGGYYNHATGNAATIAGGWVNTASGDISAIGGGNHNNATDQNAFIGGGRFNTASDTFATVGGGYGNTASGKCSTVPGGTDNTATGKCSFAVGRRAKANHDGVFVWADDTDADFASSANNEFRVRASNGLTVISANTDYGGYIDNQTGGGDGLRAYANVSSGNTWGALYALNYGSSPAIYASAATAGYFSGNVTVTGTMSKGGGSFKIDHPLDPANKYLYHSFVESPDMKNIYDGVVVLDAQGEAWVELPKWFGALNRDFRYQLTCIGGFAPVYIAQKISSNSFRIAGGEAGMEVSWQVTGIRQDAFANAHRIPVEEDKSGGERGKYLHAKEHGLPETMEIGYEARLRKEKN